MMTIKREKPYMEKEKAKEMQGKESEDESGKDEAMMVMWAIVGEKWMRLPATTR
jgi:hypothetical protein